MEGRGDVVVTATKPPQLSRTSALAIAARDGDQRTYAKAVHNYDYEFYQDAWAHLEKIKPLIPNDATIKSSAAAIHLAQGKLAESLSEVEASVILQPSNSIAKPPHIS